jgi:hypothetical protein
VAAPSKFKKALLAALPRLIDAVWDEMEKQAEHSATRETVGVRIARTVGRRLEKGRVRDGLHHLVQQNEEHGLSRAEIRKRLPGILGLAQPVSENTLKLALTGLRADGKIETRNSRWYPTPPPYLRDRSR